MSVAWNYIHVLRSRSYVVAPFCMDKSVYSVYGESGTVSSDPAAAAAAWGDWFEAKRESIVFDEEIGRFIEQGTENPVRKWWKKQNRD